MRPSRLGARAGKTAAAKRLHPDDGADHIPIDVDIPHACARRDVLGDRVNARMDAERESVAEAIKLIDNVIEVARPIRNHVHYGSKYLAFKRRNCGQCNREWSEEPAALANPSAERRAVVPDTAARHARRVRLEHRERFAIDHRPHVRCKKRRIPNPELIHVASQKLGDARRHVFLQHEQAQRRAALASAVEPGGHRIEYDLLGQR